ncbi:cadherin 6, type 2, K-cadherin [Sarotherodon galilaeus]
MAMITQKHRAFVSEPMLEKPVTAVPGIRPTLGRELQKEGITKVCLIGWCVSRVFRRPASSVSTWRWAETRTGTGANSQQANACTQALQEWTDNTLRPLCV